MKTLLGVIVLLLVIFGAWSLLKNPVATNEENNEEEVVSSETLTDGTYTVSTSSSMINWQGSKPLITGYFDEGTLDISSGNLTVTNGVLSGGTFTIDMTSIAASKTGRNSGEDSLSKHLKSADFFDVEKFPTSKFVITNVSGNNITGDLTIKETTKSITFPATLVEEGSSITAMAEIEIDRTAFNIRYGSGSFFDNLGDNVISDKFKVTLDMVVER